MLFRSLGPRPLSQQSAACPCASPTMASSGSSSTSSSTFALGPCGRITSQGICGWPGQGLSANVLTPSHPRTAGTHRPGPGFRGVRCAQIQRAWHRSFILLLWHTHGFSVLFSGKTVLFQGACCGGRGPGLGGGGSRCCAGMRPFILISSCGNGSRGALWPCCL